MRLVIYAYPVTVFAKKAFLAEILCRIRFLANRQRGISAAQARHDDNTGIIIDKLFANFSLFFVLLIFRECALVFK